MSAPDIDFFVHIPKTAGTSMIDVIRSQYGIEHLLRLPRLSGEEMARTLHELPASIRIIAGHAPLSSRAHLQRRCRAFTVLREPVARVLSLHSYIGREKTHRWHELYHSGELTLAECARRQRNIQTRYLSGVERPDELPDAELLTYAKTELENGLRSFGLAERFAESVLLFNAMLGWEVRAYASANVAKQSARKAAIQPADLEEVRRCNSLDIELYAFAQDLFYKRLKLFVPDLDSLLPALQHRVTRAEGKARIWRTFRSWLPL